MKMMNFVSLLHSQSLDLEQVKKIAVVVDGDDGDEVLQDKEEDDADVDTHSQEGVVVHQP